jgi:hypothetical protein
MYDYALYIYVNVHMHSPLGQRHPQIPSTSTSYLQWFSLVCNEPVMLKHTAIRHIVADVLPLSGLKIWRHIHIINIYIYLYIYTYLSYHILSYCHGLIHFSHFWTNVCVDDTLIEQNFTTSQRVPGIRAERAAKSMPLVTNMTQDGWWLWGLRIHRLRYTYKVVPHSCYS